jgi:uncharacterized membrane protein (UPF0127 family)
MTMRFALTIATALALASAAACGGGDDSGLATVTIVPSDDEGARAELTVEVPRTYEEFSRGLMFRETLPEDRGMLFVFGEDTQTGFWMKDTSIALSIAFIAEDGTILDIQEMEPLSTEVHQPPGPYRYALEANQGWFRRHGFGPGDRVEVPDSVEALTERE